MRFTPVSLLTSRAIVAMFLPPSMGSHSLVVRVNHITEDKKHLEQVLVSVQ